jgi:hypothetical protein
MSTHDDNSKFSFKDNGIEFLDYPFPSASIYPSGTVAYELIKEVDLTAGPLEVRLKSGEVLFIDYGLKERLKEVAGEKGIPVVSRVDVWGLILEPFLDTEFDEDEKERTLRELERNAISRDECMMIRSSFAEAMFAYNISSGLWDWCNLGLFDLLNAHIGRLSGIKYKLPEEEFAKLYRQSMEIAGRALIRG